MRRRIIYLIVTVIFLSAIFIAMYVTNIYEVVISITPKELFADNQSQVLIEAYPINAFSMKIPFRTIKTDFNITAGKDLVKVLLLDSENGKLILKSKSKTGLVTILIKPEKALLPSEINIPVHSNLTSK